MKIITTYSGQEITIECENTEARALLDALFGQPPLMVTKPSVVADARHPNVSAIMEAVKSKLSSEGTTCTDIAKALGLPKTEIKKVSNTLQRLRAYGLAVPKGPRYHTLWYAAGTPNSVGAGTAPAQNGRASLSMRSILEVLPESLPGFTTSEVLDALGIDSTNKTHAKTFKLLRWLKKNGEADSNDNAHFARASEVSPAEAQANGEDEEEDV